MSDNYHFVLSTELISRVSRNSIAPLRQRWEVLQKGVELK